MMINYYNPLKKRIDELTTEDKSCPDMEAVINETLEEMEIKMKYSYFCRYEFYILKKPQN